MGVTVLLRVVIGRQCSWFPVDVTVKVKCEPCGLCACSSVVPSDERVWAEWLIREVGVIFCFVFRCSLVKGVGCKGFYRFIALF